MTRECERVRADAPGLAALAARDPDRLAAWAHARGCAGCAAALREGERLHALIGEWEPPPLPAAALERASLAIAGELRREARRRTAAAVAAVCASAGALVALARSRSGSPRDWAIAAVLWAIAVLVAAMASRKPLQATAAAVLAATAAAAISGRAGPLAASIGVECLLTELASGAVVLGAAWLALRGGTTALGRSASAAAAAGALAGGAALQIACAAHAAAPHLLVFHVGGVVVAALAATLLWPAPRYEAA